ncbi:oocyte zinc finger protein XlCOF8.4-like, partial [Oryzias melastigma]|uniref:oocyte zinc finger protein XlCOF8.4-like n=1 Tax=Oryzias melastigma TaxID=30732 RepID=UPI00168D608D
MSSFAQKESVREQLSAAEETFRLCEGTIVQNENEELCGQRRLLDITWNPQLQLHVAVLPDHWVTEEEDLSNQQRNFREEQEDIEPPQTKEELNKSEPQQIEMKQEKTEPSQIKEEMKEPEHPQVEIKQEETETPEIKEEQEEPEAPEIKGEQEEPEPPEIKEEQEESELPWVKEEQEHICISQDEEQLDLKQEIDTLMEIPSYEENDHSETDLNNQKRFSVTESQDEEGNQHEESSSTTDEETDQQIRDQRKKRDRSHVQRVDSSHMSASSCDSDVRKKSKKETSVEKLKQSPKEKRLSSVKSGKRKIIAHNASPHMRAESDGRPYVCKECGKCFGYWSQFKTHMGTHTRERPFSCRV